MAKGAAKKGKGTGSPNTKSIGASARKWGSTLNPWGKNIPMRGIAKTFGSPSGSSMKKPHPDPSLKGMDYPANDPLLWPVEIDKINHTKAPPTSGISPAVINKNNLAVEQAYHRAGYQ